MTEYPLITWEPGGSYYLIPCSGGFRLAFDARGRRLAAYGHVYATEAEARTAAHLYATY